MHSYIDVSMVMIFSSVLALLILILISFIISSRSVKALEKRLDKVDAQLSELSNLIEKANEGQSSFDSRIKVLERSLQYFTDHAQHSIDVQKAYDVSINSLNAQFNALNKEVNELKQQLKKKQQPPVQGKSINDGEYVKAENITPVQNNLQSSEQSARELLRQGIDEKEVVSRTGLPAGEVDMISKMLQPALNDTRSTDTDFRKVRAEVTLESAKPHMVASLKARNAYGMSLRRR